MIRWPFAIACVMILASCRERDKHGNALDTPTSGCIRIAIDASVQPLIDAEIEAFESIYTYADIEAKYVSEAKAIDALLNGDVQLAIVTRRLTPHETALLEREKLIPRELTIAREGVALIVHPENPDSIITVEALQRILNGQITTWKELNPETHRGYLRVVFGQPDAGIVRFLRDSVAAFDRLPDFCYALDTDSAVIRYVAEMPDAIGLIGVSWLSDDDDRTVNTFLKSVRVVGLAERDDEFYQPHQAYIARGWYPFVRDVIMVSREARTGLATGFMAFVAGDKGQRVVLKAGLVPAAMPLRIVEINREPI